MAGRMEQAAGSAMANQVSSCTEINVPFGSGPLAG